MKLQRSQWSVVAVTGAGLVLSVAIVSTHTYIGLETGSLVSVRVESPNASQEDMPLDLPDTDDTLMCFKVRNNKSGSDSRVTAIGFDLEGDLTGFTLVSSTEPAFRLVEGVSNVPELPDVTLDFALVTGPTFHGGDPHEGLPFSLTASEFCVSGPFPAGLAIERLLDRGVARVKRIGPDAESADLAVFNQGPFIGR